MGPTFTVLLDGEPLSWTRLADHWGEHRAPLVSVCPARFDVAAGLGKDAALALVLWLTGWLPIHRVQLVAQPAFHPPRR